MSDGQRKDDDYEQSYAATDEFRRVQEASKRLSERDVRSYHRGISADGVDKFGDEDRRRLADVYGRLLAESGNVRSHNVADLSYFDTRLNKTNVFQIYEVKPLLFHDIFEINQKYLENGELVDVHEDYRDCRCFLTDDGLSCFALEKDGNIVSMFSLQPSDKKGFLYAVKDFIHEQGGTHCDCYVSYRQPLDEIYEKTLGFATAARMAYNMEFDHDGIGENHRMPDVAFMVNRSDVETKTFAADEYEQAKAYQLANIMRQPENNYPVSKLDEARAQYEKQLAKSNPEMVEKAQKYVEFIKISQHLMPENQRENLTAAMYLGLTDALKNERIPDMPKLDTSQTQEVFVSGRSDDAGMER